MLYVVGGVAKSGKSYITKIILNEKQISSFSTDYLMMGLSDTIPGFSINPDIDRDEDVAKKLYPVTTKIMKSMLYNNETYLFEGVHIRPKQVRELIDQYPNQIKAVYLVYDEIDTMVKVEELNKYVKSRYNTWLNLYEGEKFVKLVEILKEESLGLKLECIKYNIPYVQIANIIDQTKDILDLLF